MGGLANGGLRDLVRQHRVRDRLTGHVASAHRALRLGAGGRRGTDRSHTRTRTDRQLGPRVDPPVASGDPEGERLPWFEPRGALHGRSRTRTWDLFLIREAL